MNRVVLMVIFAFLAFRSEAAIELDDDPVRDELIREVLKESGVLSSVDENAERYFNRLYEMYPNLRDAGKDKLIKEIKNDYKVQTVLAYGSGFAKLSTDDLRKFSEFYRSGFGKWYVWKRNESTSEVQKSLEMIENALRTRVSKLIGQ